MAMQAVSLSLLWLLLYTMSSTAAQMTPENGGTCQCEYVEQPPNELQCNPYLLDELRLECSALIPASQLNKELVWFRSHLQTSPGTVADTDLDRWIVDRLDTEQPNVQIWQQELVSSDGSNIRVRSQLRISNLNDSYVGDYLCRLIVDGSEWLIPSDSVYLQQSSAYTHFGPCSSQYAQSKQERKCADWDVRNKLSPTSRTVSSQGVPFASTDYIISTGSPNTNTKVTTTITAESVPDYSPGSSGSGDGVLMIEEERVGDESGTSRSLQVELYVSISILILFGVIIVILVPVMLYMCFRQKNKVNKTCRRRPDLARIQPTVIERRSATLPADYLVPQPFLGLTQTQLEQQSQRLNRSRSLTRHSYETTLGFSHEYEDVVNIVDSGSEKREDYVNVTQPKMERNAAYRACSTSEDERGTRVQLLEGGSCHDIVIPNPLNCINTQSYPGRGRMSDVSDDQNTLVNKSVVHSYEQV